MKTLLLDVLYGMASSLQKKPKPTLLALQVWHFTNSSWLQDVREQGRLHLYLDHGKGGYLNV